MAWTCWIPILALTILIHALWTMCLNISGLHHFFFFFWSKWIPYTGRFILRIMQQKLCTMEHTVLHTCLCVFVCMLSHFWHFVHSWTGQSSINGSYESLGDGNGTPLQYSCLENPMGGGAWWAAVYGIAQSRTQLKWLHFHFLLSCIAEGNGNPLQCSCLENPRDGGAWWAAVYGIAQSQTQLKWLSSSSMSH